MFLIVALVAAAQQSVAPKQPIGRTAWVFATIAHSEWCPAGNVMLDLHSGKYTVTSRAPRPCRVGLGVERPITRGKLDSKRLEELRAAYLRALQEGLEKPNCEPFSYVLSNGGRQTLVVTSGAKTESAPSEPGCWSEAANGLAGLLEQSFSWARTR